MRRKRNDVVIVAEPSADHPGLAPGEEVVTTGSLILEQMYEDRVMAEGGFCCAEAGRKVAALVIPSQSSRRRPRGRAERSRDLGRSMTVQAVPSHAARAGSRLISCPPVTSRTSFLDTLARPA